MGKIMKWIKLEERLLEFRARGLESGFGSLLAT
jgi:hypothetical protein